MEETIKKDNTAKKEFESLLNQDLKKRLFKEGEIVSGVVEEISKKFVYLDIGGKSSSAIPIEEFKLSNEIDEIKVGSKIKVLLERLEHPRTGGLITSREKARKAVAWQKMEKAFQNSEKIEAKIVSRIKGGYAVDCQSCLCFLPNSQLSLKPLSNEEIKELMRKPQIFEIVKMDKKRGNIVVSRRQHLQRSFDASRDEEISKLKVGMIIEDAIVKALTPWGAFIMVNNLETLCHINEISHSRITAPSDLLRVSQKLRVKIIKIDPDTKKVSTSIKALTENPFNNAVKDYKIGSDENYMGIVTSVQDYGVFVKLEKTGIEGLVHQSEIDHLKKNIHPSKVLSVSQSIPVRILEIDQEKNRLSLSYKRTMPNPWDVFCEKYKDNVVVNGVIRNITDYALFLDIEDTNISGMLHYRDLDYSEKESELQKYKKKDKIKVKILEINKDQQRVRLSKRALDPDPFEYWNNKKISDVVTVTVENVTKLGVNVYAKNRNFSIFIKKNQLAKETENQRPSRFVPGQKVDCEIIEIQKDKRKVSLSIKTLEEKEAKEVLKKYGSTDSGGVLSDIFDFSNLKNKKPKSKK